MKEKQAKISLIEAKNEANNGFLASLLMKSNGFLAIFARPPSRAKVSSNVFYQRVNNIMKLEIYETLLTVERKRKRSFGSKALSIETESDRGRIVFSSSFRRLQQKAQVFPLESNAAVRTRLTHSLEVAHTGRYLAQTVLEKLEKEIPNYNETWLKKNEQSFITVVESACLIHDIGNPPFGHFGEAAIAKWFESNKEKLFGELCLHGVKQDDLLSYGKREYIDFLTYDGNAQGLRLVSKLQGDDGKTGLNLTYTLLSSYMKYSCLPHNIKKYQSESISKKPGFFNTEADLLIDVWDSLKMSSFTRHPLSYLMEAADDIAYCLSDIEDGIEKGILTEKSFFKELKKEWKSICEIDEIIESQFLLDIIKNSSKKSAVGKYTLFKTSLINSLVTYAAEQFIKNHDEIVKGNANVLIHGKVKEQAALKAVRVVVGEHIFQSSEAEEIELAGFSVITGLLEHFSSLLELSRDSFTKLYKKDSEHIKDKELAYEKRLLNRLSGKARKSYEVFTADVKLTDLEEWHLRAHMIVDHISGMTDDYALKTFQLLSGIKVVTH